MIFADPLNETPFIVLAVCNVVAVFALPDKAPANVVAVTVPGKLEFPDSSNSVTDLVTELFPAEIVVFAVYCNRYLV